MNTCKRHRFPPDIISYAVWLSYRFNLSYRDIEDLLAQRWIIVTRESIGLWCLKFGVKDTWSALSTIEISGSVRSQNGIGRLLAVRNWICAAWIS